MVTVGIGNRSIGNIQAKNLPVTFLFDVGDIGADGRNVGNGTKTQLLIVRVPSLMSGGSDATPQALGSPVEASTTVDIRGFAYQPRQIEAAAGSTVVWTNLDGASHTVTFRGSLDLDSGQIAKDGTFLHQFTEAGRFNYECFYHANMTDVVVS